MTKNQQIDKIKYEIPKEHQKNNLFIQISSVAKHANVTYFCTSLKVQLIENYGQVKVTDQENRPLTKVKVIIGIFINPLILGLCEVLCKRQKRKGQLL